MPAMLNPQDAQYVAVPSAAQPVQRRPDTRPAEPGPEQQSPFRLRPGPPILIIPHEPAGEESERQSRGRPVRLAAERIPDLLQAARQDPYDLEIWRALADAWDQDGQADQAEAARAFVADEELSEQLRAELARHHRWGVVHTRKSALETKGYDARAAAGLLASRPDARVAVISHEAPTRTGWTYSAEPTGVVHYRKSSGGRWARSVQIRNVLSSRVDHSTRKLSSPPWPQPESPEQLSRSGPVRLAAEQVPDLWRAIDANAHDPEPWHALADEMEQQGKPTFAEVLRQLATAGRLKASWGSPGSVGVGRYRYLDGQWVHGLGGEHAGHIAGIPVIFGYGGVFSVGHHDWSDFKARGIGYLPADMGAALVGEFDPPEGQQLRRTGPVRLAAENIPDLWQAVQNDPLDDDAWHALADELEQQGRPTGAELMRGAAAGMKLNYPYVTDLPWSHSWRHFQVRDEAWPGSLVVEPVPYTRGWIAGIPISVDPDENSVNSHIGEEYMTSPATFSIDRASARRLIAEFDPEEPERFAQVRAPAGGFVTRGIFGKGGQFLPREAAPAPHPAPPEPAKKKRSARERVKSVARRSRQDRDRVPIRLD